MCSIFSSIDSVMVQLSCRTYIDSLEEKKKQKMMKERQRGKLGRVVRTGYSLASLETLLEI